MNAPLPPTMYALPDSWLSKIFTYMSAMYGSKFADMWNGVSPEAMRAVWSEKLGEFVNKPECIKSALDACKSLKWPPTLPEFYSLCVEASRRLVGDFKLLDAPTIAPEQIEKRIEHISKKITGGNFDGLAWAKKLKADYVAGCRLIHCQLTSAAGALGEDWHTWRPA